MKEAKIYIFLFSSLSFFTFYVKGQQVAVNVDSVIQSWEKNGVPKGHEKDYSEYLSSKKKIDSYRNELDSRKSINPENNSVQADSCNNSGFESGDFSYWYRFDGHCSGGQNAPVGYYPMSGYTPPGNANLYYNSAIGGSTFTIETIPATNNFNGAGYDPYAHNGGVYTLPLISAQGGGHSARVNNNTHGKKAIKAEYVFNVPLTHPYFVYSYAVVMSDGTHATGEQAGIRIKAMYMNGTIIPSSLVPNSLYETNVNSAISDPSFSRSDFNDYLGSPTSATSSSTDPVYYKNWTRDTLFLCPLVGQNIRISFEALDCIYGGHFCYIYVDGRCNYGPPLNNAIVQNVFCPDSTNFTLTAPGGFPGYQWYDHNGNAISNAQTGNLQVLDLNAYVNNCPTGNCTLYDGETFSVSIISPGGCTQKVNAVLKINKVQLGSYTSTPTCNPANHGSVSINVTGGLGSGTYTYNWYANSCTGTSIGNTGTMNNLTAGNYCVHVASGQCPPLDTILKVNVIPIIPQQVVETIPPCQDSIAYIHASPNDSAYKWYNNGVLIPNENKDSLKINPLNLPATYEVTFIDTGGCYDSTIIKPKMDVPEVKLSSFISTPTCKEGHNGALAINVTGGLGSGTYNFNWYANSCTGTSIGNANTINNLFTGNYCVHVTSGYCPPLDTVLHIGIIPMVPQYVTESLPPCLDSIAYIHTNKNDSAYKWYQNSVLIPNQNNDSLKINPMDGTSKYEVTYYDNKGCLDTMIITPNRNLFESVIYAVYCPNDSVATIYLPDASSITGIQWFYNGVPIADSLGGKRDSISYLVYLNQLYSTQIFINDTLHGFYATYYVNGCKKLANAPTEIFPSAIFIPDTTVNTFTPNDDGINDKFYPFKTVDYSSKQIELQTDNFELNVFNRWGKLVFHSDNYSSGWDGRNNMSEPMSDGTYFWIATFKSNCDHNGKVVDKGYVNLAR